MVRATCQKCGETGHKPVAPLEYTFDEIAQPMIFTALVRGCDTPQTVSGQTNVIHILQQFLQM